MAITISGENNNDRILAQDGVIDSISGFNIAGIITASSFTGDLTGDVTGNLSGNVTGNINNTTLLLQTGGSERVRIASNGKVGVGVNPQNYPGIFVVSGDALICDRDIHSRVANSIANSDRGFKQDIDGTEKLHLYADNSSNIILENNGGNEKLRITSAGKVGIGTDFIDANLTIHTVTPGQNVFNIHADLGTNNNRTFNLYSPSTDSGNDYFRFQTGNSIKFQVDSIDALCIKSDGDIGIRTDSPRTALDIYATPIESATINTTNSTELGLWVRANTPSNTTGNIYTGITLGEGRAGLYAYDAGAGAAHGMGFWSGSNSGVAERLRIDSNGRILIGHSSTPQAAVSVAVVGSYGGSSTLTPFVYLCRDEDATSIGSNESLGQILFASRDGYRGAVIEAKAGGTWSGSSSTAYLVIKTTPDNATVPAERLTVGTGGNVTLKTDSNIAEAIRIAPAVDASSQQEFGIGLAVNSSHTHPAAKITFKEFDASDSRGDLLFYTRGANSDSAPEERLRIASTGVATFTNDSPPATGVGVLFVTDDGSATTLGTAATLRVANNGGNSAYSVFEAQSGSGSIRLANDGQFYVSGASTFSNDIRVDRGSAIDGLLGQAYGGYFGLKQADQSYGSEYMILSNNSNTYISCTSGYAIYLRPSANSSSHETIFAHDNTTFKSNIVLDNHQLRRNQHHKGHMEGSYNNVGANSGKSNPIYTIGSSYNPAESTLSNMYGIGYSHGNNASFISFSGLTGWGLYVAADGDCRMFLDGTTGKIAATGTITGSASDVRLKTNIKVIDNPIEKIKKIRGVTFDWVDNITSEYDFHPDNMHETGVIAQEIQEVIPDAVATAPFNGNYTKKSGTDNNYLTVKNEKIIPLCIEAIKKLTAKVEALESEVNTLKGS